MFMSWVPKVRRLSVLRIGMPKEQKVENPGEEESRRDSGLAMGA